LVCLAILVLGALYWDDLRWAAGELPGYLEGSIGSPQERKLYVQARRIILEEENIEPAEALLQRSIAIDPYGEGRYWLGRYYFELRRDEEALEQFEAYLEIDPTMLDAYLKIAAVHAGRGRAEAARRTLERGLAFFEGQLGDYEPHLDASVDADYNTEATRAHARFEKAVRTLEELMLRLER